MYLNLYQEEVLYGSNKMMEMDINGHQGGAIS